MRFPARLRSSEKSRGGVRSQIFGPRRALIQSVKKGGTPQITVIQSYDTDHSMHCRIHYDEKQDKIFRTNLRFTD